MFPQEMRLAVAWTADSRTRLVASCFQNKQSWVYITVDLLFLAFFVCISFMANEL